MTYAAFFTAFYVLIFPDSMPTIKDAPWEDLDTSRAIEIAYLQRLALMAQPDIFFWT